MRVGRLPGRKPRRGATAGEAHLALSPGPVGAPLPVVWTFEWAEKTPATGALEYEVYDEGACLAQFRVPDFVLSPGKNELNALLPAFFVSSRASLLTIHGRFVTGKRSLDFDEQTLRVPTSTVQWFSVGVAAGPNSPPPESQMPFFDQIRIEAFLPPDQAINQSATVSYELRSTEIPNDPLTMCNFDVFVLTPPALAELRRPGERLAEMGPRRRQLVHRRRCRPRAAASRLAERIDQRGRQTREIRRWSQGIFSSW